MRRAASIVLLSLILAPCLIAQPKEELIYPRSSAPADAPASADGRSMNSSLLLVAALIAAGAGWWLWHKRRAVARFGGTGAARLAIIESRSLGSRQYLVVAGYDGRRFLLGVCPGSIAMLTPLDKGTTSTPGE